MKTEYKVIVLSIIFGLLVWMVDAVIDYFVFYAGSFGGSLIYDISSHNIYMRSFIILSFLIFGILISRVLVKRKRVEEQIKKISRLKEDLLSSSSLDGKLKRITDGVVEIFDADFSRIWITKPGDLCDSDCMHAEVKEGPHVCLHRDRCLHLMASSGRYAHIDGKVHRRVPFGCHKIGCVAAGKDPKFLTNDVTHDPRVHDHEWARKLGLVAFAGYRLLSDVRKPIGVLALFSKHAISPDEDSMLEVLANTTSQVIQATWAEEELIKTKEHLDNTIESSLDGIVTGDSKGNIVSANEAFLKLIGYHKEEIKEMHIMELSIAEKGTYESTTGESVEIDEEFFNDARKMTYEKLFKEGKIINWETYYLRKDRRIVPVEQNIVYLYNEEEDITGSVGIIRDITERRKAEKKIKESRDFLENIYKTTADGIMVTDNQGCIVSVNKAIEQMLGFRGDEIVGKYTSELGTQDEERIKVGEVMLNQLFEKGYVKNWETLWYKKDETLCPVEINITSLKDQKGNLSGTVGIIRDITEGKKAEKELRRAKSFLENVIETIGDGLEISDEKGQIFSVNTSLEKMSGYRKEELVGQHTSIFTLKEDKEMRKKILEKMSDLFEKGNISYESAFKSKDGKIVEVECNSSMIKDERGNNIAGVSVFRNISDRKKIEKEIKEARDFLKSVIENSRDGIIICDEKGYIISANAALEKMCRFRKEEMIGEHASLITTEDKDMRKEIREKTISELFEKGFTFYEAKYKNKDGKTINVECNTSMIKNENGDYIAGVSIIRDITERKEMEHKLLQSEKLKSLGELAGGVAHDFNNVLAAILGRAQLLKMIVETPQGKEERRRSVIEMKEGLEVIEKASRDGAETVRRIQEFARRRDDDKHFTTIDLNEIIDNALEFTKVRWKGDAESKGIKINIKKELSTVPTTSGSASELREVFTNLINNAIDAMPQGGKIKIKTFKEDSYICVKVEDTGIGIPKEIRDRIFDPFFTTKGPQSSGLGMSVSYGIVHRHRGTVTVDSIRGKGTVFTIKIPISEKADKEEKGKSILDEQRKAQILVIEDEDQVRNLLSDILKKGGHEVEIVSDGSKGIKLFKKKEFDLVFTDLGMPGMSGWQVAEKVKGINRKVPVALITGWNVELNESEMRKSGVDLLAYKPFEVKQVFKLVQDAMILRDRFKAA